MDQVQDPNEGTVLSAEDVQRVRELLDPQTKAGRVCLRMLDHGETVDEACGRENADVFEVMGAWHRLTDDAGIRCVDGKRPCISTLANAWKRSWQSQSAPMWAAVDAPFSAGPFMRMPKKG